MTPDSPNPTPAALDALRERIAASIDYSRNFATAKPDIGATEREHIVGLCNLLAEVLDTPQGAQPEAVEPFAYVICEGNSVTTCAELAWPLTVGKGKRGAKRAWRDLKPGLHPLYLHPALTPEQPR